MSKINLIFIFLIFFIILSSCKSESYKESVAFAMDTVIEQKVWGQNAEGVLLEVEKMVERLDGILSAHADESDLSKINFSIEADNYVKIRDDTFDLIRASLEISEKTYGYFDITIGSLDRLWNIGSEDFKVPDAGEISKNLEPVGYKAIDLNERDKSLRLRKTGALLDLGAMAKGYACDLAIAIYRENNIERAIINMGGDVFVYGEKEDGSPFNIGIRDPFGALGSYMGVLSVKDAGVATSGVYERFSEADGIVYGHIIDPFTGYPADAGIISSTVIGENLALADAVSTACYIMGVDKAKELINSLEGVYAIFIDKEKRVFASKALEDIFKLADFGGGYVIYEYF